MMNKRKPQLFQYAAMQELLLKVPNDRERLFFLCAYANGMRIKEAWLLSFADIQWDNDFLMIRSKILKKKDGKLPTRNSPVSRQTESWLTEPIIELAQRFRTGPDDQTRIFQLSKRTAQKRADDYFGATAHSLRHNRTSHLMIIYNYQMRDLQEFFGLEPTSIAEWQGRYGHLEKSYLRDKWNAMKKNENKQTEIKVTSDAYQQ
jgi:integrase